MLLLLIMYCIVDMVYFGIYVMFIWMEPFSECC